MFLHYACRPRPQPIHFTHVHVLHIPQPHPFQPRVHLPHSLRPAVTATTLLLLHIIQEPFYKWQILGQPTPLPFHCIRNPQPSSGNTVQPTHVPHSPFPQRQDALSIPFAFDAMAGIRHPATATKTSVFFAINPSLDMMRGFANGCRTNGRDWRLQLVVLSNYAPLQIHKINPYVFCPVGETGENDCKQESLIAPLILPDAFTDIDWGDHLFDEKRCDAEFAVEITGMDYIDEVSAPPTKRLHEKYQLVHTTFTRSQTPDPEV